MITEINNRDMISMKLLHYFITKKNYNPIIVQGVENEIWLENLDEEYKVVRIVNNYIHNDEQMDFDVFKTKRMVKKIKRKTFTFSIKALNILTDVGDNVDRTREFPMVDVVYASNEEELLNNNVVKENLSDLRENMNYSEEGFQLFLKITEEINNKNRRDSKENDRIFEPKKIIVNYVILGILALIFLFSFLFNKSDYLILKFGVSGPLIRAGDYFRLLTGAFIHTDILHLLTNGYALYIVGNQIENFYGKKKFIIIYLISALTGSLLSICMHDTFSIGASGAIFGLLGSLLYFGYHYRVYFGSVIINKVLPVIIINLIIGFTLSGIDNFAHIGGLIGGILSSMALGINSKDGKREKINGIILTVIYIVFLVYLGIFAR